MEIGSTRLAADGYVDSTNATRIFALIIKSGGTAAVVAAQNGSGGTEYDSITGTINTTVIRQYPGGLLFPSGCYIDLDTNTSYVTAIYERNS